MKVSVTDRQRSAKVDCQSLGQIVRHVMQHVKPPQPAVAWEGLSVILTDDALIRRVNQEFLSHDETTDVISFAYYALPGQEGEATGEIFVNVQQALRLGPRYGGPARELALYAAHGCDHLSGADDTTPVERRRMRDRECRWLRSPEVRRLMRGLVRSRTQRQPG